ncbi:hypothetical protein PV326_009832 [Microctonus aethiopoides]|nr:hypothetical protein PV326_009832 [Microctonus aethiopoides]
MIGFGCGILLCIFAFNTDNEIIEKMTPYLLSFSSEDISCYAEPSTLRESKTPNIEAPINEIIADDRNIFFHETSCFGKEGIVMTSRQACAIESAAMMNPTMKVHLFILSNANYSNETKQIIHILTNYKNVIIQRIFMEEYVKNTPIQDWWESGVLRSSRWPKSHMSDILRYLTLWKFGGIYLDLDVVVISSLEKLYNFAGAEDWEDVAAGVIGFSTTGLGRRIADACLRDLKKNFRGNVWGNNGPGVITRTLQKLCATKYARDMTSARCHGFTVYPPSVFYPIHYKMWKQYFDLDNKNETLKAIEKASVIHVWNKLSQSKIIEIGSEVPYAVIANKYCPKIYNNCGKTF